MSDFVPAAVMRDLDLLAGENTKLGADLAELERRFEPIEEQYENFISDYITGLWTKYCDGELKKWPGEDVRLHLAHKAIPPDLYGRYTAHKKSIARIDKRLRSIKTSIEAKRSILSALKIEMEAAGAR